MKILEGTGNTSHASALALAREVVKYKPRASEEYRLARALLDLQEQWQSVRWIGEDELRNLRRCCDNTSKPDTYGHNPFGGGLF